MEDEKPRWRQWLEEAKKGVIGNTAYDILKWILAGLWIVVGPRLVSWLQRLLGTAVPFMQRLLSTEVFSTQAVVTVGMITSVTLPLLVLAVIWAFIARRRWLGTREREEKLTELSQLVEELEKDKSSLLEAHRSDLDKLGEQAREIDKLQGWLQEQEQEAAKLSQLVEKLESDKKNLLDIQRSNHDILNQRTRESNELHRKLREQKIFKVVYYDPDYVTRWIKNPEDVASFFAERGFDVLGAEQLGRWVDERIKYGESCQSLLVFAQDAIPETVADLCSETCKLRLFLNEGARIAWHGDVPFWYQALPRKRYEEWMANGPVRVLRLRTILMEDHFAQPLSGILTNKGRAWGITLPGPAQRPVPVQDVDDVFTVGPPIRHLSFNSLVDIACSWRKIFNPRFPHSGFLRYWPGGRDGKDASINTDYFRFAVSGWSAAPETELPEVQGPQAQTFVSSSEADTFRRANTGELWKPAAVEPHYRAWARIPGAQWIWWQHWVTPEFRTGGAVEHRREFALNGEPKQATLMIAVDDRTESLRVNGVSLGDDIGRLYEVTVVDLAPHVRQGKNVLEMTVVNVDAPKTDENPTGLCYRIDVTY